MSRASVNRGEIARLVSLVGTVAALVVAVAIGGRPALYATGLWVDGGSPTVPPELFEPTPAASASPSAGADEQTGAGVIGAGKASGQGHLPDRLALSAAIAKVPTKGLATTSAIVLDATTGQVLHDAKGSSALVPASTMKLLTSAAALHVLGAETRFTTRVTQPAAGQVVLVGGGDPHLSVKPDKYPWAASSTELARATAAALKAKGQLTVSLGYDESLFAGPAWNPAWPEGYHDQVTTTSALWIDQGRETPTSGVSRTPAATAAVTFAAQLKAQGITVKGAPQAAKGTGAELATVQSLPVRTIVQELLVHSDNSTTEVMLRHIGRTSEGTGSTAAGLVGVKKTLVEMKVPITGLVLSDGSGLSRSNRVSAATLAGTLRAAVANPELAPLLEGLPVAGATGTLTTRFWTPESEPGRGYVHAKTGTLTKVSTLAGMTRTAGGRDLVFCLMTNNQTDEWGARVWLDRVAGVITASK